MNEYEEQDKFFAQHWANDLLKQPVALISVIETKIARAELSERRRIRRFLETRWDEHCDGKRDLGECSVCWLYNDLIENL